MPVSVANKPGGNQALAMAYLNQHAGDAHYLVTSNPTINTNHIAGMSSLRYTDFSPLALLASEYTVFTVAKDSALNSFADFSAQLSKAPGSIAIGITTRGGTNHVVLCLAARTLGVDLKQLKVVSFKSNAESMTALLGGHLQMVVSTVAASIEQVRAGNARFLAISAPRRMKGTLANTPTLAENGIGVTKANWRALVGPRGLKPAEIAFWEQALAKLSKTESWRKDLEAQYWLDSFLSGRELVQFLEAEYVEDKAVLTQLGLVK